jgi:uncharacterized damage-inducible protein DinB
MFEPLLNEFQVEAACTRRVLERIPADKLSWRPHPRSMSLGQLAQHIAGVPGRFSEVIVKDHHEADPQNFANFPSPENLGALLATFDQGVRAGEDFLAGLTEAAALQDWTLMLGGKPIFTKPRMAVIRMIMLNHWYHHRGQLSVYLRLLDVPVPSIYGPSADENPFA